jgi:hypothetical protein
MIYGDLATWVGSIGVVDTHPLPSHPVSMAREEGDEACVTVVILAQSLEDND